VILGSPDRDCPASSPRVVLVCRNAAHRAALDRLLECLDAHTSAMEALLAVVRRPLRAVVLNLEDVEGAEHDLLAAVRRADPGVPVYLLVRPEDEPAGRALVREGATDYVILPSGLHRLPRLLAAGAAPEVPADDPSAAPPAPGAPPPAPPGEDFEAACALAALAGGDARSLLDEGARLILRTLRAGRGTLLAWNRETLALDALVTEGEASAEARQTEASLAAQAADAAEALWVEAAHLPEAAHSGAAGLLALPVGAPDEAVGVLCAWTTGAGASAEGRRAAAALAQALGRLYQAAVQREQYARLALRDAATGLLRADAFQMYLEKRMARAAESAAHVALALLEASGSGSGPRVESAARLGRALEAAMPKGARAGRLGSARFAVAWAWRPEEGDMPPAAVVRVLEAAALRAGPALRLRTATAAFPEDAALAQALLEVAEARLAGAG